MFLKWSLNDEFDFETLTNWANQIECRGGVGFKNQEMKEFVFEFENPEINGDVTKEGF